MLYVELLISRARVTHNVYNAVANLCARNLSQIHNNRKKEKIKAFLCSMENPSSKSLTLYRSHEHPPNPDFSVCFGISLSEQISSTSGPLMKEAISSVRAWEQVSLLADVGCAAIINSSQAIMVVMA